MNSLDEPIMLVPLGTDEFSAWRMSTMHSYAEQIRMEGRSEEEAWTKAQHDTDALLTHGVNTPGHHIMHIVARADDMPTVGYLWWFVRRLGGAGEAFIFDIQIEAFYRRQGYACAALRALEGLVRQDGLASLSLHVFASNTGAISLYESLGYQMTTEQKMTLSLS